MARVLSVNIAHGYSDGPSGKTGFDKRPTTEPVAVRAPGHRRTGLGSGLAGDLIGNRRYHGGDDQAVYAYAREDLDDWEISLQRPLTNGMFGENLTTAGVDVTGAVIGERWAVGSDGLVLEVSRPRTPCRTFTRFLGIRGWMGAFTRAGKPGAYLRVITPGQLRAGDGVTVTDRPDHGITIGYVFRAIMTEPELLPDILVADALAEEVARRARRRLAG
ncbi:MOSC domain-containing protein [Mycolicibacterium pulveris]|uniref:Molybdenum cofactor biosysynthesis protein n=1 Tax=Mycolicibacterium pulveris TaxID=36813 RepID=A0A7I7UK91_MYCPV|nr:MOSC domain-containing protein [Mycolicibacterium pulveris]MCV6979287.1 MOSC domain-containing protein [Mycolicibacterium pulveris]BBY81271.1 molybdenum cofactor biosysynthesis protein [Mycolicibacterium pulveris]